MRETRENNRTGEDSKIMKRKIKQKYLLKTPG